MSPILKIPSLPSGDDISPQAAGGTKLTAFNIVRVSGVGKASLSDTSTTQLNNNFSLSQQNFNKNTALVTEYFFDPNEPIIITYYREGYGYVNGFEDEKISTCSILTGRSYNYTYGSDGSAVAWNQDMKLVQIDPALSELQFTFTARSKDVYNKDEYVRDLTIKLIDERADFHGTPRFVLDSSKSYYVLEGVDSSMEYRLGKSRTWKPCTDEEMHFDIPTTDTTYGVRYAASENAPESKYTEIVLPGRPTAPNVSINWLDESFKNLTTSMEYQFGGGDYMPVDENVIAEGVTPFIDQVGETYPVTLRFRKSATATAPVSSTVTFNLYPRSPEPTLPVLNSNTYVFSGMTSSIQYLLPGDKSWRTTSSATLNVSAYALADESVRIYFRSSGTKTTMVSKPLYIDLPRLAAAPVLHLDYKNETVTGLQTGVVYQYRTGTGTWKTLSFKDGTANISGCISGSADVLLSIWAAATEISRLTDAWQVTLPKRPAAPSAVSFEFNNPSYPGRAVLNGVSSAYEYMLKGSTEWTSCNSSQVVFDLPTAGKTYYVRLKCTSSSFASYNKVLTLYAPASAPTNKLNTTTEVITIAATMEYRIDNGSYTTMPSGTTTFSATDLINALSGSNTRMITLRYAATATRPASKEKVITLVARRAAPNTVVYNAGSQTVSGTSSSMQYRAVGSEKWLAISKTSFSVSSLVSGNTNLVLEFRYKPTSSLVGSYVQRVNCF